MKQKRPYIITLFGDYNTLGAIILILSFFPVIKRLPITVILPEYLNNIPIPDYITKGILAVIILAASYGYLGLKKWGYWLIVSENLFFLAAWFLSYVYNKPHLLAPSPILTIIELIFIVPTVKYFYKKTEELPKPDTFLK